MSAFLLAQATAQQFFSNTGIVLSGGRLYTYVAGTTTPQATYTDSTLTVPNANPIILDSAGRTINEAWAGSGSTFKLVLADSSNNVIKTWDNLALLNDTQVGLSEWTSSGFSASFVNTTTFTVVGNAANVFQPGRRVKAPASGGFVYGSVSVTNTVGGTTTVTMLMDGASVLDVTLTGQFPLVSILGEVNPSVPTILPYGLNISAGGVNITGGVLKTTNPATALLNTVAVSANGFLTNPGQPYWSLGMSGNQSSGQEITTFLGTVQGGVTLTSSTYITVPVSGTYFVYITLVMNNSTGAARDDEFDLMNHTGLIPIKGSYAYIPNGANFFTVIISGFVSMFSGVQYSVGCNTTSFSGTYTALGGGAVAKSARFEGMLATV